MEMRQNAELITFQKGETSFSFLPTGDIFEFTSRGILINQFQGSAMEGSANNIYLRIHTDSQIKAYPLLGVHAASSLSRGENSLVFTGQVEDVSYRVCFYAAEQDLWFWDVALEADHITVDIMYGQDIGVAAKGGVLSNELYMAQYLGHSIFETENGYVVCSRQNMAQGSCHPYLQQGMIRGKAVGYATDGTQFFGLSYKASHTPEALAGNLPNQNYQYEFAYTSLQSEKVCVDGRYSVTFYGLYRNDHPEAIRQAMFRGDVSDVYRTYQGNEEETTACKPVRRSPQFGAPYTSPAWDANQLQASFPDRKLEETDNGQLLSFFTEGHSHVVLQAKELMAERPHGHIIMENMNPNDLSSGLITSTNYIYGLFNAQTVIGNTSIHKFISPARGILNVLKNHGQRIFVKLDGTYRLLTLPAVYEMGMNFSRWYYELPGDTLVVTAYTVMNQADLVMQVNSATGQEYDFTISTQLVLGENEFQNAVIASEERGENQEKILRFVPDPSDWKNSPYPGLCYDMRLPGTDYTWSDDRIFFTDNTPRNGTLLTVSVSACKGFQLIIQGHLENAPPQSVKLYHFEEESAQYRKFYASFMRGFHLEAPSAQIESVERLKEIAWWFSHNALVHFSVPHGLEQPGGAAWGTRDVCQGPWEFFIATQHYQLARATLLSIFSHQSEESGEWPQWFMFDKYPIYAGECHGDVVFWPLKCVSEYLHFTGDFSIMDEQIPYLSAVYAQPDKACETLLQHVKRAVENIQNRFIPGTSLITYAGGDWDDTLQPADETMKKNLISAWTMILAYQVLRQLGTALETYESKFAGTLTEMAADIQEAFQAYCIKDGVIAGFLYKNDKGVFELMLHPSDQTTGIQYRLLPMTRSIIAEMADQSQARQNLRLIDEHFLCPDGVRLMDRPARYNGGVSALFQRAEQAANEGREVSLQYVHAHIRYVEAMAKLGEGTRAWEGLLQINPVLIQKSVPNAALRQSNVYFSSSDGLFMDRYDYHDNYQKLRDGSVAVRGGWRLYSSGPGIYMNQLISQVLGIRLYQNGIVIDPVLPSYMDGLRFTYTCFGQAVTFVYRLGENGSGSVKIYRDGQILSGKPTENIYRGSGIWIDKKEFLDTQNDNIIEIVCS